MVLRNLLCVGHKNKQDIYNRYWKREATHPEKKLHRTLKVVSTSILQLDTLFGKGKLTHTKQTSSLAFTNTSMDLPN